MPTDRTDTRHLYRSLLTGEPITLSDTHLATVRSDELLQKSQFRGSVNPAQLDSSQDRKSIEVINKFYWDSVMQDVFGRQYDIFDCDNLIARPLPDEEDATCESCHGIAGHVAIKGEDDGFLHIVVFNVWPVWHGRGVGKSMLEAVRNEAKLRNFPTIKLATTNDNLPALYFYQRLGFVIEKVIPNEVTRTHGSDMIGYAGIPVRDEFQLRLDL